MRVGDYLRLTAFRGNVGVWWALVTGVPQSFSQYSTSLDVLCGPDIECNGMTYPVRELRGWALGQGDVEFEVFKEADLPDEYHRMNAARALLGRAN